jgi:asparagine synthase (glutamine-hydrolysing)
MCGIAAIFAYGEMAPPVDRDELIRMRDQMASRGPDGTGEWLSEDRRVGLGHRRLSIIDLSHASDEPLFNADRSLAITFNGEIYNYRELRSRLSDQGLPSDGPEGFRGYRFMSQGDAEVVLAMYETRGIDETMQTLRGMYAFAIWDRRKQGMLLARDPFGIKPLYYSDNGHTIRLASQVKALRAGGNVDTTPDPAGHVGFFLWGHVPDPFTAVKGIRSLPAGSTMWVDRGGAHAPKCFCNISSILADAETAGLSVIGSRLSGGGSSDPNNRSQITNNSLDNRDELLRSALAETVKYHLVADVPVGVFLSSGLDSTTIAALAAEQGGNLRTVTLGFEEYKGTDADETPLAEDFAKRCGANHQTIWVSRADFEAERDHLFESMDRPTIDGVNTFFVSLAARQANLKVALSGVGGDELFATYPSFRDVPRTVGLVRRLPLLPTLGREFRMITAPILKQFTSPKYAGIFEYGGSYSGAYLLRRGLYMPWELPDLLDPDMVKEGWAELQTLLRLDETLDGIQNPRLKVSALELQWYMRHQLLRDSDWAGMGHSVEIRVPFVDVDFLKQIGPMLSRPDAPSKRDMAAAASKLMTPEILDRRKTGFQIPVREWLTSDSRLNRSEGGRNRGLRGWAREVYSHFAGGTGSQLSPGRRSRPRASAVASRKLRILVLLTDGFGGKGGIAKFNRDFLSALASSPNVNEVVALPRLMPNEPGPLPEKLRHITTGLTGKSSYVRTVIKMARELRSLARRENSLPVIISAHINLLPAAVLARHLCGGRLYLVVHGIDAWKPTRDPIANRCTSEVDDFISVSSVTRRRFLRWSHLRQDLGVVLPNCVDLSAFKPGPKSPALLKRYGLEGRTVLMTLGRLASEERYKGFDELIEILPRLAQKIPNVSYIIAGEGQDRARLEQKARDVGVADRVVFTGFVSEEEKADHYRLADVYVMPSSGEGFGIVFLEALACGIPVIGSKTDGSRDALLEGELGSLVNPTNLDEIENAVLKVLQKPEVNRTANGANGSETVDHFSSGRFDKRVHDLLAGL